jgi:DNA-nicking Smr family endonuclease
MWLPQFAEVLAFHSAPRHLGGTGATVILLRKSERARQENFEKHSKRAR